MKCPEEKLKEFSPTHRLAIELMAEEFGFENFHKVSEEEWRKKRNCGVKFLEKIHSLGWASKVPKDRAPPAFRNFLYQNEIPEEKETVKNMIERGEFTARTVHGVGILKFAKICEWCGAKPKMTHSPNGWKFDPYTGEPFERKSLRT